MVLPRRLRATEVPAAKPSRALHDCGGLRLQAKAKTLELQGDQQNRESTHINTARRGWNPWSLVEVTTQRFTKSSEGSSLRQRTDNQGNMQIQSQNQDISRCSRQARKTTTAAKAKARTSSSASRSNENLDFGSSLSSQSSVRQPSPLEPTSMLS